MNTNPTSKKEFEPLFEPGRLLIHRLLMSYADQGHFTHYDLMYAFYRHMTGDFGDLCASDKQANRDAIRTGDRILSKYRLPHGHDVYIETTAVYEGRRESTTIYPCSEY